MIQTLLSQEILREVEGDHSTKRIDHLANCIIRQFVTNEFDSTYTSASEELADLQDDCVAKLSIGEVKRIQGIVVKRLKDFLYFLGHFNALQFLLGRSLNLLRVGFLYKHWR